MKALLLAALAVLPIGVAHADSQRVTSIKFCRIGEPARCGTAFFSEGVTDISHLIAEGGACEGETLTRQTCTPVEADLEEVR